MKGNAARSKVPEYTSPFDLDLDYHFSSDSHLNWAARRADYAHSGDDRHLQLMLDCVTMDCPPDAPKPAPQPRRELPDYLWFWILTAPFWIVVFITEELTGVFF